MTTSEKKDTIIAVAVTFLVAALMALLLIFTHISLSNDTPAKSSPVEIMPDEELFIDPELLLLGEENAVADDAPAQALHGQPEPAQTEVTRINVPGINPKPAPPVEKHVVQKKPSPVKATEPQANDEERSKAASAVAAGFSPRNGREDGNVSGASGSKGSATGVSGNVRGRKFLGCPKPDVALRHKTVVKVMITVDAEGRVISASASGSADAAIRRKCEQAARAARWSEKPGASETRGSITFTITPR